MKMDEKTELIIRQVAIKCSIKLAANGRIPVDQTIDKAEKIVAWIKKK